MKRIILFLSAIMLTSITLFTSCTDDTDPVDLPPTINFVSGSGFISGDETMSINTLFNVKILAQENATSGTNLKSLKITRVFNLDSWDTTLTFNESTYTGEFGFYSQSTAGVEKIEFKVTDSDGETAMVDVEITTQEFAGGAIDSWQLKMLGSWNNLDEGSSFASINGNVYMLNEAFVNQTIIDFMYWWAASTNSATIGAPNDPNAAEVFNTGPYQLANWTIAKNPTKFKTTTLTSANFDAVADATVCVENATGASESRIANLDEGEVIGFITVTGKHGLIRVKTIVDGSAGSITIDVKVQK